MARWFNTAGPCVPSDHYFLPPEQRLPGIDRLIDQKTYFIVHAPRQVGKTTAMMALAERLTEEGRFAALMVSAEVGAPFGDDVGKAEGAILSSWRRHAENRLPEGLRPPPWPSGDAGDRIGTALQAWAKACPRPLVLFSDEIDALRGEALLSVLRELIPTVLATIPRASLPQIAPGWLTPSGELDAGVLLATFLAFWRQHGEPLMRSAHYHEIAPHLVLMAFLHRVANGGGSLEREYAIGSGRMDLCLRHGAVTLGIELKVWRDGDRDPAVDGFAQLDRYLAARTVSGFRSRSDGRATRWPRTSRSS